MVRECRPPEREPGRSWVARRSTMATSTPANANSPANIIPVGPPPATTTACSAIRHPPIPVGSGFGRRFCSTTRVLPQAPGALYTENGEERVLVFHSSAADGQVRLRIAGQAEHQLEGLFVGELLLAGERAPGVEAERHRDPGAQQCSATAPFPPGLGEDVGGA